MKPFNRLTPAEAERLAILGEELGETLQAIGKILRHGYASKHPNGGPTNRESLQREMGHIDAAFAMMLDARDVTRKGISDASREKSGRKNQYLHHQTDGS